MEHVKAVDDLIKAIKIQFEGTNYTFNDMCTKSGGANCQSIKSPIKFWLKPDGTFDISGVTSDADVVTKYQSGKGDATLYPVGSTVYIPLKSLAGGMTTSDS
jgi:hypothetical protein